MTKKLLLHSLTLTTSASWPTLLPVPPTNPFKLSSSSLESDLFDLFIPSIDPLRLTGEAAVGKSSVVLRFVMAHSRPIIDSPQLD